MRFPMGLKISFLFLAMSLPSALAQTIDILPPRLQDLSNTVITSNTVESRVSNTRIKVYFNCYAINLRGTPNPIAPQTTIIAYFDFIDKNGAMQTFITRFPSQLVAVTDPTSITLQPTNDTSSTLTGVTISAIGNTLSIDVPQISTTTVNVDGSVTTSGLTDGSMSLVSVRFDQYGAPPPDPMAGNYVGVNGPLSGQVSWTTSKDGRNIEVHASFPGAALPGMWPRYLGETRTGFCGGWYSPLMLFFDDQRPRFTGKSDFKVTPQQSSHIYWPEAGAPGYFLALDKNKNGKIDDGDELFGNAESPNGFEALAKYDENHDGYIDENDPIFKQLLLWQDKNGDGISQPNELFTLESMHVKRIRLKPKLKGGSFGNRAKYPRQSVFEFTSKSGKVKTGVVLDIWFSDAPAGSLPKK